MATTLKPRINHHPYQLSASIICSDFANLGQDLKLLQKGSVDYFHIDIMDGTFVPRFGIFPEIIKTIKSTVPSIPIDVHLMITNPDRYIPLLAEYGADIIVVHVESNSHLHQTIHLIKKYSLKVGVALNPATPLTSLEYLIDDIDLVEIMGINPGILGQNLISSTYRKISDLRQMTKSNHQLLIEVDGGVNFETSPKLINSGADILVCGNSTLFNHPQPLDIQLNILRQKINQELSV